MSMRRSLRFRIVALLAAATATLAIAGCSPFAGKDRSTNGKVNLTLVTLDGGSDNKALDDIISGFEAANPGIKVTATWVPEDTYPTKLKTMLLADPPDIASPYGWGQTVGFEPLNKRVFDKYGINIDDYSSVMKTTCQWQSTVFCVGTTVGSQVILYNKKIFDEKKLPYPDAKKPMTFDEMADLAAKLSTRGKTPKTSVYGADMGTLLAYLDPADVLDDTGRTVQVTKPEFTGTVKTLARMVADGSAAPAGAVDSLGGGDSTALLVDGRVAMQIGDNFEIDTLEHEGIKYGIAPTPIVAGSKPWIVSWTNGYGIPKRTKHPAEAAKFLAYMLQGGQKIQAKYGIMPTKLDAANKWANTPERKQLFTVNSLIRPSVFNPDQWAWNAPILDAVTASMKGGRVDSLLAGAQPKAQQGNDTTWKQFDQALAAAGLKK
jgi:multiple sugar transport system substrate-binding protein